MILSQILRGFSQGLAGKETFLASDFAAALQEAARMAYTAVIKPVEGTILTVAREMAEEAEAARDDGATLETALDRVLARAEDAPRRTPDLLAKLREAGVVDAGGAGLVELARGAIAAYRGAAPVAAPEADDDALAVVHPEGEASVFCYCTSSWSPARRVRSCATTCSRASHRSETRCSSSARRSS